MQPLEFLGDVEEVSHAKVNTKGGSLTATLRKAIRERLGHILGSTLSTAALSFSSGTSLVLMGSCMPDGHKLRVSRTGKNSFLIELDDTGEDTVDDVTAAFLTLRMAQLKEGKLNLDGPMSADDWLADIDAAVAKAQHDPAT